MLPNPYSALRTAKGKALYVPFTVLGDPDLEQSLHIVESLIRTGADALELGLPFSDPPADGAIIQAADSRALRSGVTINDCFQIMREVRRSSSLPLGLLVYFNLVFRRGIDRFYRDCADAGVTSVLVADLPLEHADACIQAAVQHGVAPVFMVSERTTEERLAAIARSTQGYIYVVSYVGITGREHAISEERIARQIQRVRRVSDLPLIVGFGINTLSDASVAVRAGADGVIVASRLIRELPDISRMIAVSTEFATALR